jgi:predicted amidohydrolase
MTLTRSMRPDRGRLLCIHALLLCMTASCKALPSSPPSARIHVAAIQLTPVSNELQPNQENVERLVREAAGRGARYILLPEYFPGQVRDGPELTLEQVRAQAEPLDGPIAAHMLRLCRELGVHVAFPLAERQADGKVYNSTVYAGPDGIEGVYSKHILISMVGVRQEIGPTMPRRWQEDEVFEPGTRDGIVTWGGVRVGALICADGGVPGIYAARVAKHVQLITHASASAGAKIGENNPMPDAAARRYGRPVIFANQWTKGFLYQGNTQICDAAGNVLARVGPEPNRVIDAVIELPPG